MIDEIAAQATLTGKVKGRARRAMTAALTIRASVLMALTPDAGYAEIMAALLGDLVLVPWQRPYQVPTAKVLSTWRTALGPAPLAELQARLLAAVDAEHRDHDYRAVRVGDSGHELQLCSIDGSVTRVPDTPANRAAFGSTGTADDSAPYPQVRDLLATDASTRAALAVVSGPSGGAKAEGEQALLDTMLTSCPQMFTADRLFVLDRNFPGAGRVAAMLATGTHVLIRVKSDLALPRIGGFLPDGSYYSYLTGGGGRWCLKVRVIEYQVDVDGQDTGEMFCLITDLLRPHRYPAAQLAAAYAWRWTGSETSLKEAKVRHHRRRALHRPDLPLKQPRPDRRRARRLDLRHRTHPRPGPRRRPPRRPRQQEAAAPGSRSSPAKSRSPPPAAPPWPASDPAPPPRACPPRWPRPSTATPCAPSANAASSSTATGTATAKPKPARHSPAPDAASPRAPRSHRSASARRQQPDRHARRHRP